MDETSPTARALLALELIQGSPGITADRLADKLGVSERAARRYVGILREAGIPIESVRGPLRRLPRRPRPAAAAADVQRDRGARAGDGRPRRAPRRRLIRPARSAARSGKIVRALPGAGRGPGRGGTPGHRPGARPRRRPARPGDHDALVRACSDHRRVRLEYRSESGKEWTAEVDPWAVVVRHGRWYLLCWSRASDAAGRTASIGSCRRGARGGVRPAGRLDPVEMLEEHLAVGWEYSAEVVIDAPLGEVAPRVPRTLGRVEPVEEDTCRLVGTTSNPWWYAEQLTALPAFPDRRRSRAAAHRTRARPAAARGQRRSCVTFPSRPNRGRTVGDGRSSRRAGRRMQVHGDSTHWVRATPRSPGWTRRRSFCGSRPRVLLEASGIGAGMRVLDLGTGAGHVAIAVAELVGLRRRGRRPRQGSTHARAGAGPDPASAAACAL